MNYHLMIDHWFINDFIETAEKISPNNNTYVLTYEPPSKYVKSSLGIFAPYGSKSLDNIIAGVSIGDKVYVHWFHAPVMNVLKRLPRTIPVYLFFWGGDFVSSTKKFFNFNHDRLTKKYLRACERANFSMRSQGSSTSIFKYGSQIMEWLKFERHRRASFIRQAAIRTRFLSRLNYFCHWNCLDMDIVTASYGGSPKFVEFFYDCGWDLIPDVRLSERPKNSKLHIWLGNSDTPSNNHLDAIYALNNFRGEDVKITCPLSYGVDPVYAEVVSKKGHDVFNDKWNSLMAFIPLDAYLNMQKDVDVVVMYHNRTQAAGNVFAFIKSGAKVYLKRQSTLYEFLIKSGIYVCDANTIMDLSFEEFSTPLTKAQIQSNCDRITKLFSGERKTECYKRILLAK